MDPTNAVEVAVAQTAAVVDGVNPTVGLFIEKFEQFLKGAADLGGQAWNEMVPVFKQVFEIYARQSIAYGVSELITSLLAIGFCALMISIWWKGKWNPLRYSQEERNKLMENDSEGEAAWFGIWGVPGAFLILISIIVVACNIGEMSDYIRHIINPEYYAIQDLTEVIRKIKP